MNTAKSAIVLVIVGFSMFYFIVSAKVGSTNPVYKSTATSEQLDNRFFNCTAAKKAGFSNVIVPPEYRPKGWKYSADRDRDGIACESR